MWRGEFAEIDAKAEAKRIGGTCVAYALYTTPQPRRGLYDGKKKRPWVGLTEDDKKQIAREADYHWKMTAGEYAERIGQLTEDKLKEKNT